MSSIRTRVSKVFHLEPDTALSNVHHGHEDGADRSDSASVNSSVPSRVPTPMLDPSTNTNPLEKGEHDEHGEEKDTAQKKHSPVPGDVSKHTFYVLNSQMRLKFIARNEVNICPISYNIYLLFFLFFLLSVDIVSYFQRQMLQFITALEKKAASSHYTASNRFDSFAPIRLNVAAQWLVDGVRLFSLSWHHGQDFQLTSHFV